MGSGLDSGPDPCCTGNLPMAPLGRSLIILGISLIVLGLILSYSNLFSFLRLGRLPGDIIIRRERWSFYFPLTTSILISVLLTLLFSLFSRR